MDRSDLGYLAGEPVDTRAAAPAPRRSRLGWYVVAVIAFLAYAGWMLGPYLRSVIVRDAAVTTWAKIATAPIDGQLPATPLQVGSVVDASGVIALVRNPHLSGEAVATAEIRVRQAQAAQGRAQEYLAEMVLLAEGRADLKARYAQVLRRQLDSEIAGLERRIAVSRVGLATARRMAARSEELARRGNAAAEALDEDALRVSELELEITNAESDLDHARVRREAADHGVFIGADGDDPDWARGDRLELKIEKERAHQAVHEAVAELALADAALQAAKADFSRRSEAAVTIPAGSVLWGQPAAPGAMIRAGAPVVRWLDCAQLMVDVPVSDAEVALVRPGMTANVVLEGERSSRPATVLLTRGSASVLGEGDLAALAKGRAPGMAQVLLDLPMGPDAAPLDCPIGRAAHVDFDGVGLIDVLRARLRL